jgi:phosphoglucosamine mutase
LQVLSATWRQQKSLSELLEDLDKLPQVLKNVRIAERCAPMENPVVAEAVARQEARFAGQGRVLLRASGTEPLIRVMAEGTDSALVNEVVDELVHCVELELA